MSKYNDLWCLAQNYVNDKLRDLQLEILEIETQQKVAYGDSIYPHLSHIKSRHVGENLNIFSQAETNTTMDKEQS